jgi:hypothetical protein
MVKDTKSNPASKRSGVKNDLITYYQCFININLTAMP